MDNLIDFDSNPTSNVDKSNKFSILVPVKSPLLENVSQNLISQKFNLNENTFDIVGKTNNLSTEPFEFQFKKNSKQVSEGDNLMLFEDEDLNNLSQDSSEASKQQTLLLNSNRLAEFNKVNISQSSFIWNTSQKITETNEKDTKRNEIEHSMCSKNDTEGILIDFEDNPITTRVTENSDNDSNKSTPNSDKNSYAKYGKNEIKNKLLKLSLSNALIQSPLSRRCSLEEGMSPETSIFNEAAKLAKQLSQMNLSSTSSSPKKSFDDSCDDLMEINPNWVDSESDISKDLELLRIPMLDKIEEDMKKNEKILSEKEALLNLNNEITTKDCKQDLIETSIRRKSIDINELKEKVKNHKMSSECSKSTPTNIDSLISNLKEYVLHCDTECTKKDEAEKLLNSLSYLLRDKEFQENENEEVKHKPAENTKIEIAKPLKPLVRQGTFHLDDKKNDAHNELDNELCNVEKETTLDSPIQSEMNELVDQIGKMFGGTQNVNVLQANLNSGTSNSSNPTYIFLMGTPNGDILNNSNIQFDEILPSSPDQKQFRRRSYSLTLPNKKVIKSKINESNVNQAKTNVSQDNSVFKTPNRSSFLNRRNSISSTNTDYNTNTKLLARRSIYANSNTSIKNLNTPVRPSVINSANTFQSHANETTKSRQTKCIMQLQTDISSKRFRLKSNESVATKGPLKATAQMNSAVPIINRMPATPIQSSNIRRKTMLDTNSLFSTNENIVIKNQPIACSTPTLGSPKKVFNTNKFNRSRLSTTPNAKSNLLGVTSNLLTNRRKSFSDTSSKVSTKTTPNWATSRNVKLSQGSPKIVNKFKLPSTRIQQTLINKENKEPKK